MDAARPQKPKPTPFELWARDRQRDTVVVERAARSGGNGANSFTPADLQGARKVLEVRFADGSVLLTDPLAYAQTYGQAQTTRGANGAVQARVALPFDIGHGGAAQRGAAGGGTPIDRYAISELTEPTTLDRIYDFTISLGGLVGRWIGSIGGGKKPSKLAATAAAKLCAAFENSTLHKAVGDAGGALLRWTDEGWRAVEAGAALPAPASGRVLLFLHGTASSTEGSFGKLWAPTSPKNKQDEADDDLSPQQLAADSAAARRVAARRQPDWLKVPKSGALILAWEHRSLTRSPIENVIEMAAALQRALPAGARLDLVSHSRGGLVGELISLRSLLAETAVDKAVRAEFDAAYRDHPDLELIAPLFAALTALPLEPGRFVRVACPARGTLLADGRTDLFLSLMLRTIELALGGLGTFWFDHFAALAKALVAERADAATLPGLEAMIPGRPLTRALDRCRALAGTAPGDQSALADDELFVIAGDSAVRGLSGVATLLGDVFFGLHDHDFVVHTRSMFGGLRRRRPALSLRLEAASVTHFHYFAADTASRRAVLVALDGGKEGYSPIDVDEARTRGFLQLLDRDPLTRRRVCIDGAGFNPTDRRFGFEPTSRRPVMVVLPGIMGSELGRPGESPVWLSVGGLFGGSLTALELGGSPTLQATGLMALSYEKLLEAARKDFDVIAFAYDWRNPIADSAKLLVKLLKEVDTWAGERPLHIVAHSMGGLVSRAALFLDPQGMQLWRGMRQRGSRLLMLGTPNKGSYSPAQLLLRQDGLARTLALAARKVDAEDLARYGARYEGLLAMLPQADDPAFGNLFEAAAWQKIHSADSLTTAPDAQSLQRVAAFVAEFAATFEPLREDAHVLYVAGTGETVVRMRAATNAWTGADGEAGATPAAGVEFMAELAGDGTVPWTSTLKPERTWYAPCEHGTLADHSASFAAYFELLRTGGTQRLPQQQPRKRSGAPAERVWRARSAALVPESDAALQALFFGRDSARDEAGLAAIEPIRVRVIHGGLDYARFPVLVGHYQDESLNGPAKRVDEQLAGQLQTAIDTGLFRGADRTAHYLRPPVRDQHAPAYPGAIVLGLGQVGELTPGLLADTVTRGVMRYAFEHVHRDPFVAKDGVVELRLSAVLVGTSIQAMTVRDSLGSVLFGVWRAAQRMTGRFGVRAEGVQIREIEIIEIEENVAHDAAYELRRLLQRPEWQDRLRWSPALLQERAGAVSGYQRGRSDALWQRLIIGEERLGGLNFELIGARARVEATRVQSDVQSLAKFVERICDAKATDTDRISDPADPRLGGVLFQMLLPLELKDRLANLDNTVLVLSDASARYPWELLSPPLRGPEDGTVPRPFAIHAGMVRQRSTADFRRIPQPPIGFDALIVGAPATDGWLGPDRKPLNWSPLYGAEAEARAVSELLAGDGRPWRTTDLTNQPKRFEHVRFALLERPYRVLHLCGHGTVDQWISRGGEGEAARDLRKTGMVLSDQQLLTAADVEQLSPPPELVFINCCYSGRDGDSVPAAGGRNYPQLASSLALAFIEMGAKAVVAAGWQVDDDAALIFAQNFYREMLAGAAFGEAVLIARQTVHAQTGHRTNTWGAYQCYGDPQWTLASHVLKEPPLPGRTSRLDDAHLCMSAGELADRVLQVGSVAGDKPAAALLEQLDELVDVLGKDEERREWLTRSRVRAALADAYQVRAAPEPAARWYQLGARRAESSVAIGQLEKLIKAMGRARGESAASTRQSATTLIRKLDAISEDPELLWPLTPREHASATAAAERRFLAGEILLRGVAEGAVRKEERVGHLQQAAECFAAGYRAKKLRGEAAPRRAFALANALLAAALAGLAEGASHGGGVATAALQFDPAATASDRDDAFAEADITIPSDIDAWLSEAAALELMLAAANEVDSFWSTTNRIELKFARCVLAHVLDPGLGLDDLEVVAGQLSAVRVRPPTPAELGTVRLCFDLVAQLARPEIIDGYADLRHALQLVVDEALPLLSPGA